MSKSMPFFGHTFDPVNTTLDIYAGSQRSAVNQKINNIDIKGLR